MVRNLWKGDRVVEGTGLENRRAVKRTEGSNPSPSAKKNTVRLGCIFLGGESGPEPSILRSKMKRVRRNKRNKKVFTFFRE